MRRTYSLTAAVAAAGSGALLLRCRFGRGDQRLLRLGSGGIGDDFQVAIQRLASLGLTGSLSALLSTTNVAFDARCHAAGSFGAAI
jgi:hypothetical protein